MTCSGRVVAAFGFILLAACSGGGSSNPAPSSSSSGDGGASSTSSSGSVASGTTFCVVNELITRTCPSPVTQSHDNIPNCKENISDCRSLIQGGKSEKDGNCDVDTTYRVSTKNELGPHPGTCKQYLDWDDGVTECIDNSDCPAKSGAQCREDGLCYCGDARFARDVTSKYRAPVCDGTRVAYPRYDCVNGAIADILVAGTDDGVFKDCAKNGDVCRVGANGAGCSSP